MLTQAPAALLGNASPGARLGQPVHAVEVHHGDARAEQGHVADAQGAVPHPEPVTLPGLEAGLSELAGAVAIWPGVLDVVGPALTGGLVVDGDPLVPVLGCLSRAQAGQVSPLLDLRDLAGARLWQGIPAAHKGGGEGDGEAVPPMLVRAAVGQGGAAGVGGVEALQAHGLADLVLHHHLEVCGGGSWQGAAERDPL